MFWRFLLAMFCASCIGMAVFAAAMQLSGLSFELHLHGPSTAAAHPQGTAWIVGISFIVLLNFLCAVTLVPLLLRRIRRARSAARAWTQGDTRMRILDRSQDEFGELTRSFDRLADSFAEVIRVKQHLAAADERNRLARELHDTAKHRAFALSLQLTALKSSAARDPDRQARIVATALALVGQLQSDLAGVIQRLAGSTVAELGMRAVLAEEVPALLEGSGVGWTLDIPDAADAALREAPAAARQILLIAIEAVANAREHARARRLAISIRQEGAGFSLGIDDDGQGFDAADPGRPGMGLANMRARARSLPRGEFSIASRTGAGTRISVAFALDAEGVPA